jgi:hypothetical protein
MIARLGQLSLGGREIGPRRPQRIALVLRLEARNHLPGLHPIPELVVVFENPAGDAEGKRDLVLRFDATGQRDRNASFASLDRHGPDRTGVRRGRFDLCPARREQRWHRQCQQPSPQKAANALHVTDAVKHDFIPPFRLQAVKGWLSPMSMAIMPAPVS